MGVEGKNWLSVEEFPPRFSTSKFVYSDANAQSNRLNLKKKHTPDSKDDEGVAGF